MARVLGAIRQSRSADDGVSPAAQRSTITAYAAAHGHTVIHCAEDLETSGSVNPFERDSLGPWLTDERAGEYDVIVGAKLDRLSRSVTDFAALLKWAGERHIAVTSVAESLDTGTPSGKMFVNLLILFAEFELDRIRERNRETRVEMRKTPARYTGGLVPLGYWVTPNPDGDGKVLALDAESAATVRQMVDWIIDDGWSMSAVRDELNRVGVLTSTDNELVKRGKTPKGYRWSTASVKKILRSRNILGEVQFDGKVQRGADGMPITRVDPLITHERYQLLQAALDEAASPKVFRNPKALLVDVAFCPECERKLTKHVYRYRGRMYAYYRCVARKNGLTCAEPVSMRADMAELAVTELLMRLIGHCERQERQHVPAEDHTAELARVRQSIVDLQEEADLGLAGDRTRYLSRLRNLTVRRDELAALPSRPATVEYRGTGESYATAWARMDEPERRQLLLASGVRVEPGWPHREAVKLTLPAHLLDRLNIDHEQYRAALSAVR